MTNPARAVKLLDRLVRVRERSRDRAAALAVAAAHAADAAHTAADAAATHVAGAAGARRSVGEIEALRLTARGAQHVAARADERVTQEHDALRTAALALARATAAQQRAHAAWHSVRAATERREADDRRPPTSPFAGPGDAREDGGGR